MRSCRVRIGIYLYSVTVIVYIGVSRAYRRRQSAERVQLAGRCPGLQVLVVPMVCARECFCSLTALASPHLRYSVCYRSCSRQ